MPIVITQILTEPSDTEVSVCNNATWAVGEIALQFAQDGKCTVRSGVDLQKLIDIVIRSLPIRAFRRSRHGSSGPYLMQPSKPSKFERECCSNHRTYGSNLP